MSKISSNKKLELLDKDIQEIKQATTRAREKLALQLLEAIAKTDALTLPFPIFMGGVLEVVARIQNHSAEMGVWQKAGEKFLKRLATKAKFTSTAETLVTAHART